MHAAQLSSILASSPLANTRVNGLGSNLSPKVSQFIAHPSSTPHVHVVRPHVKLPPADASTGPLFVENHPLQNQPTVKKSDIRPEP